MGAVHPSRGGTVRFDVYELDMHGGELRKQKTELEQISLQPCRFEGELLRGAVHVGDFSD